MCAPHTMTSMNPSGAVRVTRFRRGKRQPVAPSFVTAARCARPASASRSASLQAGAISEIPKGKPAGVKPAGTATAARSMRFTKFV